MRYSISIESEDEKALEILRHWIEHHHKFRRNNAAMTIDAHVIDTDMKARRNQ